MREYIKKFESPESAHNYSIVDIPFVTSIATTPIQNLVCNKTGKHLENDNGTVIICPPDEPVIPNDEIWYTSSDGQLSPSDSTVFGDEVTYLLDESTFDSVSGKGILKFDSDVTSIGTSAFNGCSGLTSIEIPNSVTSIGIGAFAYCISLSDIVYTGTSSEWATLKNSCSGWNDIWVGVNTDTVHCSDTDVSPI